jgi:diadenosine tetraphosphatase ApaH/serine/threonine PP2A family protein phosphatase
LPTDGKLLINVGSVGQPRDLCRDACYVIYNSSLNSVEFRRIAYDIAKTRRKIMRAKLPPFSAQRLSLGR